MNGKGNVIALIIIVISNASGIKSKHITAIISPDANANMKLRNLLECFFVITPIIPPSVVPKVPKNKPTIVVFSISPNFKSSFLFAFLLVYWKKLCFIRFLFYSSPFNFSALSAAIKLSIISSRSPFRKFSI